MHNYSRWKEIYLKRFMNSFNVILENTKNAFIPFKGFREKQHLFALYIFRNSLQTSRKREIGEKK